MALFFLSKIFGRKDPEYLCQSTEPGLHGDRLFTRNTESPVIKNIGDPDQNGQTSQRNA